MRKISPLFALLAAVLFVLAAGCDTSEENTTIVESPTAPGEEKETSVDVAGSVKPLTAGFQMTDESRCFEGDDQVDCRDIHWRITEQDSGIEVETVIGDPMSTVQVSGLTPGPYVVRQTAFADDGTSESKTYNVEVPES